MKKLYLKNRLLGLALLVASPVAFPIIIVVANRDLFAEMYGTCWKALRHGRD